MEPWSPQGHPEPRPHAEGSSLIWGQRWEKWEGMTPLAKERQPGRVRLAGLSRASLSLAHPHVSGSMRIFGGERTDREADQSVPAVEA